MPEEPQLVVPDVAPPTSRTASWIEDVTGSAVIRSTALVGGMSSEVTRHELADGRIVVSRHITDTDWLDREPHLIDVEATALRLLADADVSAPDLIATGPRRLAMSFVAGEMLTSPGELHERVARLAGVAREIHRVELPAEHGLPPWRSWASAELTAPEWGDQALWSEAIDQYQATEIPPASRLALLHRDLHPLNVLWDRDRVHVVDWVNACVGHPHAELGHCRWNLTVLAGFETAEVFLQTYLATTDHGPYDRYWDLAPVMSFLPGPMGLHGWHAVGRTDLDLALVVERTESFLRAALC